MRPVFSARTTRNGINSGRENPIGLRHRGSSREIAE
jgi:hypothetical protein